MRLIAMLVTIVVLTGVTMHAAIGAGKETTIAFDDKASLKGFEIEGDATIDAARKHGGAGALKLAAGSRAVLTLRDEDGPGRVEMWIYEDGAVPADPKSPAAGPVWGLMQRDNQVLAVGSIYATYLSGDATYAAASYNPGGAPGKNRPWQVVQYLGVNRTVGWHKWTFDFDPSRGLRVLCDDQDVNAEKERFNANKDGVIKGFSSVILLGDTSGSGQVLWVDGLSFTLGAAEGEANR